MNKFKVGDKVSLNEDYGGHERGDIFTVSKVERETDYALELVRGINILGKTIVVFAKRLELCNFVAPKVNPIQNQHTFTVPADVGIGKDLSTFKPIKELRYSEGSDYKQAFRDACALLSHDVGAIKRLQLKHPNAFKEGK